MTTRIKICGICSKEDALLATSAGADAVGFVFAPGPRHVTPELVELIVRALPPFVVTVGVFVDAAEEEVQNIAARCRLQALQFQGNESPNYCARFSLPVIKGFKIRSASDFAPMESYDVSAFLLDSYVPGQQGGTGQAFDWNLIIGRSFKRPIILSGGLTPLNVGHAIGTAKPSAVDVSTGVAQQDLRRKDPFRLNAFIRAAKAAEYDTEPQGESS